MPIITLDAYQNLMEIQSHTSDTLETA